ncbi:hypothetical protein PNEG_03121 [Pneumocystis murina B123]|uniref:Spc7 kinetochore protein domain-containing protein n=1 Tax=Pneumocystis murina (strain B123) TaxID=1069680 RepID=M7NN42_PNEMU|nr:hypothetical protein PNEG_03121 [Pneumocystis murina B123]EMR08647.1 hypothetical protein PNEG_03121 [Pneumocystis murina B123]
MIDTKSPESKWESMRQGILDKVILDKENQSPNKNTGLVLNEGPYLKRSKSFGGESDEKFVKPLMAKQESRSTTLGMPNKGILKTSLCSLDYTHDSSCKNDLDNHTVIGIMQVALKDNEKDSERSETKKSQRRKSLNRRVSFANYASVRLYEKDQEFQSPNPTFPSKTTPSSKEKFLLSPIKRNFKSKKSSALNDSPKTPSPIKCISPVKPSKAYINSPIPMPQGQEFSDDIDHVDIESSENVFFSDIGNNHEKEFCNYQNKGIFKDIDGEMTMDLTEVISNPVFEKKNTQKIAMDLVDVASDSIPEEGDVEVTMDITKLLPCSIFEKSATEEPVIHLTHVPDSSVVERNNEIKMNSIITLGEIQKNQSKLFFNFQSLSDKKHNEKEPTMELHAIDNGSLKIDNHVDSDVVDMDTTKVVGGILRNLNGMDQKDGLTMDFTTTIGNILTVNEEITKDLDFSFNNVCLEKKLNIQRKMQSNTFSGCFSLDDFHKPIVVYEDDNTVDMDLTKIAPLVLEHENNLTLKNVKEEFVSLKHDSLPMDIDIKKSLNTELKSPQRIPRSGVLAIDALFGKNTLNNIRNISDTVVPIQLGSPKAAKLLKNRKSIGYFEEMKLVGLGSPTTKIIVGNKLTRENGMSESDIFTVNGLNILDRIAQLTPKKNVPFQLTPEKNIISSQLLSLHNISKDNILENSESKLKRNYENTLNNTYTISPTKKTCKSSNIKEYSDRLIETHDEDNFLPSITLTEFLKMTSISFLDGLTTTKRRETTFFPYLNTNPPTLKELVYTSSLTLPTLELYQFSCKELQKYISEGKEVVNKIEKDTSEENPLLFREYIYASHDIQVIMVGQFKLLKNYSRLYAKSVWYDWRDKLLLGLKEGLEKNLEGLKKDELIINESKPILNTCFPLIKQTYESLKEKIKHMKAIKEEISQCDQKELRKVRSSLFNINEELQGDTEDFEKLRKCISEIDDRLHELSEKQAKLNREIEEYKKVMKVNRCFEKGEIENIKKMLQILKSVTGWEVKRFFHDTVVFIYLDTIETTFNFIKNDASIKWNGGVKDKVKEFFFDYLEKRLKSCTVKEALSLICRIWYTATLIWSEFCLLKIRYPLLYNLTIENDQPLLQVTAKVFLPSSFSKFYVTFKLRHSILYEYPNLSNYDLIDIHIIYGNSNTSKILKTILEKISVGGIKALSFVCNEF